MNIHRIIVIFSLLFSLFEFAQAEESIAEPASWGFPDVIEHARKISPNNIEGKPFNAYGLVYSVEELSVLKLSSLTAEELQKYADIVTHAYPDAVAKQLPDSFENITVDQLNETTVGGIAYISIHAVELQSREKAKKCLAHIQETFAKAGR